MKHALISFSILVLAALSQTTLASADDWDYVYEGKGIKFHSAGNNPFFHRECQMFLFVKERNNEVSFRLDEQGCGGNVTGGYRLKNGKLYSYEGQEIGVYSAKEFQFFIAPKREDKNPYQQDFVLRMNKDGRFDFRWNEMALNTYETLQFGFNTRSAEFRRLK